MHRIWKSCHPVKLSSPRSFVMTSYPEERRERSRWVLERRGERNRLDTWRPYEYLVETECGPDGEPVEVATLFLTNRECPFRCVMCDLWKNTLEETVPTGAIPAQIRFALEKLSPARQIKLYNAGSFFDPQAIPREDYREIASLVASFEHVIDECHPAFIGARTLEFRNRLQTARQSRPVGLFVRGLFPHNWRAGAHR